LGAKARLVPGTTVLALSPPEFKCKLSYFCAVANFGAKPEVARIAEKDYRANGKRPARLTSCTETVLDHPRSFQTPQMGAG
jgi:hypothetical protein